MGIDLKHNRPEKPKGWLAKLAGRLADPGPREPRYKGDRDIYPSGHDRIVHNRERLREIMHDMTLQEIEDVIKEQGAYVTSLHYEKLAAEELLGYIHAIKNGHR